MTMCLVCGIMNENGVCSDCKTRYTAVELDELVRAACEPPPYDSPYTGEYGELMDEDLAEIKANDLARSFTEFLESNDDDVALYIVDSEDGVVRFKPDLCDNTDCDLWVDDETVSNCGYSPDHHDPSDCLIRDIKDAQKECEHGLRGDCIACNYPGQIVESCKMCGCGTWHKDGVCSLCGNDRNKVYEPEHHPCEFIQCSLNIMRTCDYQKNRDDARDCISP